jgi:hypothetical protein
LGCWAAILKRLPISLWRIATIAKEAGKNYRIVSWNIFFSGKTTFRKPSIDFHFCNLSSFVGCMEP